MISSLRSIDELSESDLERATVGSEEDVSIIVAILSKNEPPIVWSRGCTEFDLGEFGRVTLAGSGAGGFLSKYARDDDAEYPPALVAAYSELGVWKKAIAIDLAVNFELAHHPEGAISNYWGGMVETHHSFQGVFQSIQPVMYSTCFLDTKLKPAPLQQHVYISMKRVVDNELCILEVDSSKSVPDIHNVPGLFQRAGPNRRLVTSIFQMLHMEPIIMCVGISLVRPNRTPRSSLIPFEKFSRGFSFWPRGFLFDPTHRAMMDKVCADIIRAYP